MPVIRVALDLPLPRLFDYQAQDATPDDIGRRVRVPFGGGEGRKLGIIVALADGTDQAPEKLKQALEILRDMPPLPAPWRDLCDFCARYYQHPLGAVMALALPPMLRKGRVPKRRAKTPVPSAGTPPPALLPEQAAALAAIGDGAGFRPYLLHGITGSGKT